MQSLDLHEPLVFQCVSSQSPPKMGKSSIVRGALAFIFISAALGVPTPQGQSEQANTDNVPDDVYGEVNNADIPGEPVPAVGASGNIYPTNSVLGPQDFLATASPTAGSAATLAPDSYSLVVNQEASAEQGLILDFTNAENPQPIRGSTGATDPGPRKSRSLESLRSICLLF